MTRPTEIAVPINRDHRDETLQGGALPEFHFLLLLQPRNKSETRRRDFVFAVERTLGSARCEADATIASSQRKTNANPDNRRWKLDRRCRECRCTAEPSKLNDDACAKAVVVDLSDLFRASPLE